MIKAVIDVGTNTAHLLIAEVVDNLNVKVLLKNRHYTYLGAKGLATIGPEAIDRLFSALQEFQKQIADSQTESVTVIATDALRSASNGEKIQQSIIEQFSWRPQIITGDQEASLIATGVHLSLDHIPDYYLIMDIGGGSVEFILVSHGIQIIAQSLPLGISRLYNNFQLSDPPQKAEIEKINEHIKLISQDILAAAAQVDGPITLVGSAGTFETFLSQEERVDHSIKNVRISTKDIDRRYQEVITTSSDLFDQLDWLPSARQQYIVVAFILMRSIIALLDIDDVIISKYALKEGAAVQKPQN